MRHDVKLCNRSAQKNKNSLFIQCRRSSWPINEVIAKSFYLAFVYRLHALVRLFHTSGARISEILGVNLETLARVNYKFQVIGKGNKQRWCFYSCEVAEVLEKYIKYYRHSEHLALFTAQHPSALSL